MKEARLDLMLELIKHAPGKNVFEEADYKLFQKCNSDKAFEDLAIYLEMEPADYRSELCNKFMAEGKFKRDQIVLSLSDLLKINYVDAAMLHHASNAFLTEYLKDVPGEEKEKIIKSASKVLVMFYVTYSEIQAYLRGLNPMAGTYTLLSNVGNPSLLPTSTVTDEGLLKRNVYPLALPPALAAKLKSITPLFSKQRNIAFFHWLSQSEYQYYAKVNIVSKDELCPPWEVEYGDERFISFGLSKLDLSSPFPIPTPFILNKKKWCLKLTAWP